MASHSMKHYQPSFEMILILTYVFNQVFLAKDFQFKFFNYPPFQVNPNTLFMNQVFY
jgi:hypothetical protein